jgi:hypothetical protein
MTDQNQQNQTNPAQDDNKGAGTGSVGNPPPQSGATGGIGDMGLPPPPPKTEEDKTPANFQLGIMLPAELSVPIPAHNLKFDEKKFLFLLAGSISLSKEEKRRIVEAIPKLRQEQVDELIRIFAEEKEKFAQLSKKHVPQLEKLAKQHFNDWMDLEADYKAKSKKDEDQAKADEIRKNLGL